MVEIDVEDTAITAVDRANRTLTIETAGWDRPAHAGDLPLDVDESIGGRVESLSMQSGVAEVRRLDGDFERIEQGAGERALDDAEYVLKVSSSLIGYVRFTGPGELVREEDTTVRLEFDHPTPVTVGFWSLLDYPEATVTVAPTPTGIARGLQALPSSHITTEPKRVMPGWRDHPPLLDVGDETEVPDAVAAAEPDTGVELVSPDRIEPLFPAAPLVHHLGADVRVEDRPAPVLRAPDAGVAHEFDPMPRFQHGAARTLRQLFYVESIVKSARPGAADIVDTALTDRVGIDVDDVYPLPPDERLARYLAADLDSITDDLPRRNYAVYVPPEPDRVSALPFVVRYFGHVYTPEALAGAGGETPPTRRMEGLIDPTEGGSPSRRTYDLPPTAFTNGLDHLTEGDPDVDVVIVDNATDGQRADVAWSVYDERSSVEDGTVERRADVERDELATLLERRTDVVHVVADGPGLTCPDGRLDPTSLDAPGVRVAVLDAPETLRASHHLVEAGGVLAVGVGDRRPSTRALENVLVLFVQGFSVALGVDVVDETGSDLGDLELVGDGTHNIFEDDSITRLPLFVRSLGGGQFEVRSESNGPAAGLTWHPDTPEVESRLLDGAEFTTTAGPLADQLDEDGLMIVHDGELYPSEDVDPFYPGL